MPVTPEKVPISLGRWVPETQPLIDAHREANDGQVLLHVLLGDLARFAVAAYERGDEELVRRLLTHIDGDLQEGDAEVENAICVSFVEAVGPWDDAMRPFIDTWPEALREEAEHQRGAR